MPTVREVPWLVWLFVLSVSLLLTVVAVWCREYEGATVYTNYDFIHEENPIQESELEANEHIEKMTMTALLILLESQNKVL